MSVNAGLNKSFIALLFLSSITGGFLVVLTAKIFPLFAAKTVYFCQQLVSNTLFQIPKSLPNSFFLALGVILLLGTLSFLVQFIKTRNLLKRLLVKRIELPRKIEKVIVSLSLTNKVYLVKDDNLFSFCFGILSPRIIISRVLVTNLSSKELEAVLLHEQAHLKNLDPLKMFLGKTISSMFFFLPIFSELYKNMTGASELLADHFAITSQREATFLKEALRKIIEKPQVSFATVPALSNTENLEVRVHRLVSPATNYSLRISSLSIITSVVFLILSWFILQTPVNAFHMESSSEPSYFLCSADNACRQECHHNAQMSSVSTPEQLFSSQPPKYEPPSYK